MDQNVKVFEKPKAFLCGMRRGFQPVFSEVMFQVLVSAASTRAVLG